MPKLIPKRLPKASAGDIIDVSQMVLLGVFVDAMTAPYLGGGNLKSALLKLGAGYAASKFVGGDIGRVAGGGLIFAGAMDGIAALGLREMVAGFGGQLSGVGTAQVEDNW